MAQKEKKSKSPSVKKKSAFHSDFIDLRDVNLFGFTIRNRDEDPLTKEMIGGWGFEIKTEYQIDPENKLVRVAMGLSVHAQDEKGNVLLEDIGEFLMIFLYEVSNLDELVVWEGEDMQVDRALGVHLTAISYSTARGLLLAKFSGTILAGIILPIVNPASLMAQNNNETSEKEKPEEKR